MGTQVPDFQPRGPVKVPDFMRQDDGGICACKGPQAGQRMCPCQLRAAGAGERMTAPPTCGCDIYPYCGCPQ